MGWGLFRTRGNTLVNETRIRQAWMHLHLDENEGEERRGEEEKRREVQKLEAKNETLYRIPRRSENQKADVIDVRKGVASLRLSILHDESPWLETSLTNLSPNGG